MHIGQKLSSWDLYVLAGKPQSRAHIRLLNQPTLKEQILIDAAYDFFAAHSDRVQVGITLQTKLIVARGKDLSDQQMISLQSDFSDFSKRVNRSIFGQGNRRKPQQYSLLMLPTLEGSMFSPEGLRTLHYHVGVGNIPDHVSEIEFKKIVYDQWSKTRYGQNDIKIKPSDQGWVGYITKELEQGNFKVCDFGNAFVPEISTF
jgi:hypothetical protein